MTRVSPTALIRMVICRERVSLCFPLPSIHPPILVSHACRCVGFLELETCRPGRPQDRQRIVVGHPDPDSVIQSWPSPDRPDPLAASDVSPRIYGFEGRFGTLMDQLTPLFYEYAPPRRDGGGDVGSSSRVASPFEAAAAKELSQVNEMMMGSPPKGAAQLSRAAGATGSIGDLSVRGEPSRPPSRPPSTSSAGPSGGPGVDGGNIVISGSNPMAALRRPLPAKKQ